MFVLFVAAVLSQPLRAADGAGLYAQNCAACHGDQGGGGIGVPLALASVRGLVSDDYLRKTIRNGRPGRVMPAFAALSDAEVDAIVQHLRSWGTAAPPRYSAAAISGDTAEGKQLFAAHCANCHGANG